MENKTLVLDYWNKLADKGTKGFLSGGIISYLLLGRFKLGAILGLGISCGYFHNDFKKIKGSYWESYFGKETSEFTQTKQ